MRIAIVRKRYTFHGGAEGFSQQLVNCLAEKGHDVHIYALRWEGIPTSSHVFVHRVPAFSSNSLMRDIIFAYSAYRLLSRESFDVIQSHDKTLYQDIYRAGDGCHIEWLTQRWKRTGAGGRISIILNPYHWLILGLERYIFSAHRFKKVIAISRLVKGNITDHYRVAENDIVVIYNGVDLQRFHPGHRAAHRKEIRRRYSIPEDAFVALFVGSGFERKGVRFLIEAAELVETPLTVLVVGKGPRAFIARAVSIALAKYPHLNGSLDGDRLVLYKRINLGIAVDLGLDGLVVPVVKDVPNKSLPQIAREISDLAARARAGRLKPDEITEGTYTLSNSGVFGTLITATIVNQPQVGILSTDGVKKRPVVIEGPEGDSIAIRPIGVLAQTFDHRAIDGAYSASFLKEVKAAIESRDWVQALIA